MRAQGVVGMLVLHLFCGLDVSNVETVKLDGSLITNNTTTGSQDNAQRFQLSVRNRSQTSASNITAETIKNIATNLSVIRGHLSTKLNNIDLLLRDGPVTQFRTAQRDANATDVILDELDRAAISESLQHDRQLHVRSHIIVQSFNLKGSDIAGLALYSDSGRPVRIDEVPADAKTEEIIREENFEAGVYLPKALRQHILASVQDPVVVITVFLNDKLFAEPAAVPSVTTGIIFGVLLPGFHGTFNAPVKVIYKVRDRRTEHKRCAHWLYGGPRSGAWEREHIAMYCGGVEVCEYYHITHFGLLITGKDDNERVHQPALDIITLVGSILSVLGIAGILLTAVCFPQWRANQGNLVLANYAVATLLEVILLYVSGFAKESAVCDLTWCYWSGVLLHYVVLAQFFWVLVISHLQYKRYVQIFGDVTRNLVGKACLVGWAAPLLIVIPTGTIYSQDYINAYSSVCYPSGMALFTGVLLPIFIIVAINVVIFVLIARNLFAKTCVRSTNASGQTMLKFRLLLLLFFQLGISWVFGFLGKLHIALVYVFCLTATLQGFFVFLLFIVFNQPTRLLYVKLARLTPSARTPAARYTSSTTETEDRAVSEPSL